MVAKLRARGRGFGNEAKDQWPDHQGCIGSETGFYSKCGGT